MRSTTFSRSLAVLALAALPAAADDTRPGLATCHLERFEGEALCGTVEVAENRERPASRKLSLPVVVIPARGEAAGDPVVFIAGGPGDSSIAHAVGVANWWSALRDERDLLFVDTRGIGGADRLDCPELAERGNLQGFFDEFLPPSKVAPCYERLAERYELARFTTDEGVDDLDDVRRALGYAKLNLVGVSYGTRFALDYLRRHPDSVRTATLYGVVPTGARLPLEFARSFDSALAATFAACRAAPACATRFPALDEDLAAAVAKLRSAPVGLELHDPSSGAPVPFTLSLQGFAQTLRYMLYVPSTATQVPLFVHEAARGNFEPLGEIAQTFFALLSSDFADGYYLSVTCSEDLPFLSDDEIGPATADTLLGDFRIRQQRAACAAWPVRPVAREFLAPVRSDVPVLLVSGERDPVTPAADGERVARTLSRALHVVVPDGGHDTEGLVNAECPDRIATAFIGAGHIEGLDTSCLETVHAAPFLLELPGANAPQLSRDELARFVGTYRSEQGLEASVTLGDDDRLRLELPGKPPMLLSPRGASRFAIAGLPPAYQLVFDTPEGAPAAAVTLENGADEGMRLVREP